MQRVFIALLCPLALLVTTAGAALAQTDYPTRPIRVVVPWPVGGVADVVLRVLEPRLRAELGQAIVIDNRAGASGLIGDDIVVKSPPDGYTLLFTSSALNMNVALGRPLPYVLERDLVPIVNVAWAPMILVVSPSLNVKTAKELVALARANPGRLSYASAGHGSPSHFTVEMFNHAAGIDAVHIPYKGSPQAMADQIAGRVDYHFVNSVVALPQIESEKVVGLFVTSYRRLAVAPAISTMEEAGFPAVRASQFEGFFAPKGTPPAIIERVAMAVNSVLAQRDVARALAPYAVEIDGASTPQTFAVLMKDDRERWIGVAKEARIKAAE